MVRQRRYSYSHGFDVKAFYRRITQRITPDAEGQHGYDQINLQTQVYVF